MPGAAPVAGPGAPPAPPTAPRRSRKLIVLAVLGGLVALFIMGTGTLLFLYDRATAPDRSAPDVLVDNYLRAYLVDRNDVLARQFVCDSARLTELEAFRADLQEREKRFQVSLKVSWGPLDVQARGESATVTVDLITTAVINNMFYNGQQSWRFETRKDGGWRVCEAHPTG
jgi:hypothetical protein